MDLARSYGLGPDGHSRVLDRRTARRNLALKLAALGIACDRVDPDDTEFIDAAHDLLAVYREQSRLLANHLCPVDRRIQDYLDNLLAGHDCGPVRLPARTLVLDRHGLSRELSIPVDGNAYDNAILSSRRLRNGIVNNPANDRRTTKGSFHVATGGLPVPSDKREVPVATFGRLLHHALHRCPAEVLELPWLADSSDRPGLFTSLLLRPLVSPAVPGWRAEQRMEIRFFAPGSLVSNLDFVESIFGNAGDPFLPDNDAGLDVEGWTGTTGCVILAPHLIRLTKQELGLPHHDQATARQRHDSMCWRDPDELYNDGLAFKLTSRDERGTMVTLIADNYYGYCKKEVKTQIGYSANLSGLAEEEHAGGALAHVRFSHGDEFHVDTLVKRDERHTFAALQRILGERLRLLPDGYGVDIQHPEIHYLPEDMSISLAEQRVRWTVAGTERSIKLLPEQVYVHPSGYRVHLEKHPGAPSWRLVGTEAVGIFCHKPCTVSGGGKSEISKSLVDAVHYGPIFTADLDRDLEIVSAIFARDYGERLKPHLRHDYQTTPSRPVLSPERSLGSVIKLFTPSEAEFLPEYNAWLRSIPKHIWPLVFIIKRFYRPEWGDDWRRHLHVDIVNGQPGHELKFQERKLVGSYLRVGLRENGSWRTFKLRQDFMPAHKVQMEDDISASVVVPRRLLGLDGERAAKLVENCEHRLFQRPDDAILRGYDKQTEADLAQDGIFTANYEPLDAGMVQAEIENTIAFDRYTEPMQRHLLRGVGGAGWLVSSALPRIVDGVPTRNPRYLQIRPDLTDRLGTYLARICPHLFHQVPIDRPLSRPVDAVLCGRRNNPPEPGIRPLAVYGPIHYQDLPELFMDFIASLTGKSPSTTGAGSEGALTKGPFNALRATADLNNALVSYILCGHDGFSTAAGHIGPDWRVDHDISLLIPELWCRLSPREREAGWLIAKGYLEPIEDFEHDGVTVLASRLGYRITEKFVHTFLGKIFDNPAEVFDDTFLRPETQDLAAFVDGVGNIVDAQRRVAQAYLDDGSIEDACPPLQALLHIMASGHHEGRSLTDPAIRQLFSREHLLASDWYRERLDLQQERDRARWARHVGYLERFLDRPSHADQAARLGLAERLERARERLAQVGSTAYREELIGSLGADPVHIGLRSTAAQA